MKLCPKYFRLFFFRTRCITILDLFVCFVVIDSRKASGKVQACVYLMIGGAVIAARYLHSANTFSVILYAAVTDHEALRLTHDELIKQQPIVCTSVLLSSVVCACSHVLSISNASSIPSSHTTETLLRTISLV